MVYSGYATGYPGFGLTPLPVTPTGKPSPIPDRWTFAAGPWTDMPVAELANATARTVTWRLTGNHEASVTISGDVSAYEALGTSIGPGRASPVQLAQTLAFRIGYGNMHGPYSESDDTSNGGKPRINQFPYQAAMLASGGPMQCDLFVGVEFHEQKDMHRKFLALLNKSDPDWALCEGNQGNQLLYRPSLFSTPKAKIVDLPVDKNLTIWTVTHKATGFTFTLCGTHFKSDTDQDGDEDDSRKKEAKATAKATVGLKNAVLAGDFNWRKYAEPELRGYLATSGFRGLQQLVPGIAYGDKDSNTGKNTGRWIDDILTTSDSVVLDAAGIPAGDATDHFLWIRATIAFTSAPAVAGVQVVAPDDGQGGIAEMIWDLWVIRNGQALFRGRIGPSSDTGDESGTLVTQYSAADYRELLRRRLMYEGDTLKFVTTDLSDVAWSLISSTQAKAGGNLGIVRGTGTRSGVKQFATVIEVGSSVADSIDQLAQVYKGFEWDITPNVDDTSMTFDLYAPGRGVDRDVVLDYGGRVRSFSRQVDPSTFGNAVRASGADALASIRREAAGLAQDPAGRWDLQYADSSVTVAQTLQDKATLAVANGQDLQPSWSVVLAPGTWTGPEDFWLGDVVTLVVKAGRLDVVRSLRVVEISLSLDENDTDTITVTLGAPDPRLKRTVQAITQRLTALERR